MYVYLNSITIHPMALQDKLVQYKTHIGRISRTPLKWLHDPYHIGVRIGGHVTNHFLKIRSLSARGLMVDIRLMECPRPRPFRRLVPLRSSSVILG